MKADGGSSNPKTRPEYALAKGLSRAWTTERGTARHSEESGCSIPISRLTFEEIREGEAPAEPRGRTLPVKNGSAGASPSQSLPSKSVCNVLENRLGFFNL